jgi:hypothetical protein
LLVEAELLNPSIYANYSKLGPEFGRAIAQYFHRLLLKSPKVSSERDSAASVPFRN